MYPVYAKVKDKKYKINTDFRVALECNKIFNSSVSDEEKALAVIYLLFGDEGLDNSRDWSDLTEKAQKYLLCGKEPEKSEKVDMDYEQDKGLIVASFFTDYGIRDIYNENNIHWWYFNDLMQGLTDKCALSRVRELRNYDTSDIKDAKFKQEIEKNKEKVKLKINKKEATEKQKKSSNNFYDKLGL